MNSFAWPVRVYYEDTDAGGVVYYANYLKYLERARTEWLRTFGFEQDQLRIEHNIVFAVRSVDIHYKKPALFNEQLMVLVEHVDLRPASMAMQQSITRKSPNKSELIVTAAVNIVCLHDHHFTPHRIPQPVYKELIACM